MFKTEVICELQEPWRLTNIHFRRPLSGSVMLYQGLLEGSRSPGTRRRLFEINHWLMHHIISGEKPAIFDNFQLLYNNNEGPETTKVPVKLPLKFRELCPGTPGRKVKVI